MDEGRISQRVEIELPAKFCFKDRPDAEVEATLMNISTHGFCFRADAKYTDALNQKPIIQLRLAVSEEESVSLEVKIAWAGKTSSYNCLAGGEILSASGPEYQKMLDFYTKLFREQSG